METFKSEGQAIPLIPAWLEVQRRSQASPEVFSKQGIVWRCASALSHTTFRYMSSSDSPLILFVATQHHTSPFVHTRQALRSQPCRTHFYNLPRLPNHTHTPRGKYGSAMEFWNRGTRTEMSTSHLIPGRPKRGVETFGGSVIGHEAQNRLRDSIAKKAGAWTDKPGTRRARWRESPPRSTTDSQSRSSGH
jgi:hypothetical protein